MQIDKNTLTHWLAGAASAAGRHQTPEDAPWGPLRVFSPFGGDPAWKAADSSDTPPVQETPHAF
ncbi:MAG: hypothetical protein ACK4OP_00195 [Gemmobacter sp.]